MLYDVQCIGNGKSERVALLEAHSQSPRTRRMHFLMFRNFFLVVAKVL